MKMQETGPTVYRPYPRGLERLTICSGHSKGQHVVVILTEIYSHKRFAIFTTVQNSSKTYSPLSPRAQLTGSNRYAMTSE